MKKLLAFLCILILPLASCQGESVNETRRLEEDVIQEVAVLEEPLSVDLTYMGRASVRIDISDGRVIYIDPYTGSAAHYDPKADLVLVSHQHEDHNVVSKVTLKDDGLVISCPYKIKAGDVYQLGDIKIEAVSAYNSYHSSTSSCGFVLTIDELVIYHSGDTSTTDQMSDMASMAIDYALLCMDGFYNMDSEEAMVVSDLIQASIVIPIHTSADYSYNQANAKLYTNDNKLIVLPGERIKLTDQNSVEE